MHEASKWHGTIRLEDARTIEMTDVDDCEIEIAMHVIPHKKQLKNPSYEKDVHKLKKKLNMQGLYFYRNDRIIEYGGWHGIKEMPLDPLSLARCSVEIPPEYDSLFGVSPYKLAVEPAPGVIQNIIEMLKEERDWGKLYPYPDYQLKQYLPVKSKNKSTTKNHGIAAQRYYSEGGDSPKKWEDNEDPFAPEEDTPPPTPQPRPVPTPVPPTPAPEPTPEPAPEPAPGSTEHFRVVVEDERLYNVEIEKAHPRFIDIRELIEGTED